jgi:hypothetical protein
MTEGRGELEVYNLWFVAADADRDGVLSGLEAVQFFQRSGLPQNPTLYKVRSNRALMEACGGAMFTDYKFQPSMASTPQQRQQR